jgi:hypothetical protein
VRSCAEHKEAGVLKLVLINLRNTLILLALAYFSIPIATAAWSLLKPLFTEPDRRAHYINYKNEPWAEQHFKEFHEWEQKSGYRAYVIWRHKPYAGQTINTDKAEGIRVTPPISGLPAAPATYFFGGSTMWGEGVSDETTIPAYYQALSRETAVNYGEGGWTAHQSLNQLMEVMAAGRKPANVVFYDGVNEIYAKCSRGNNFFSHFSEKRIDGALKYEPTEVGYYLQSIEAAAKSVATAIFGRNPDHKKVYDCNNNPQKADLVAEALVRDWMIAKYIAESNGARFFAFLQPVAFLSKTRLSELPPEELDAEFGEQYKTVYPLIRAKMKQRGIGIDMSGTVDLDGYFYVDFCHLSPNGNRIVAEAIRKAMTSPTPASGG